MPGHDLLISWLKDAHAMEHALVPVLEKHAESAEKFPDIQERLREHAEETRRHEQLLGKCLRGLDSDASGGKDLLARITSAFQPTASSMTEDTTLKNALNDYAAESFEIACYKALAKAAEHLGEKEVADVCKEILAEEKKMTQFLDQQLDAVVTAAL